MKIIHLTKPVNKQFTKRRMMNVKIFFYDEDVMWFTYKKERFGFHIPNILEEQKKHLSQFTKEFEKEKKKKRKEKI